MTQAHPDNARTLHQYFSCCCMAYLDDCYLVAKSLPEMQLMLDDVTEAFIKIGLKINSKKCKWVTDKHSYPFDSGYHGRFLLLDGHPIAQCDSFVVLGSLICADSTE